MKNVSVEMVVERPGDYWSQEQIAESYDSGRFDSLKGRLYRWREERAITRELRRFPAGGLVLDAACGTGRITALLRQHGFRVAGCDVSPAMMAVARRRLSSLGYDDVPLAESGVERLPYPDRSFDAVTCIGLLMHLDEDVRIRALREFARVSRGPLILQYGCVDTCQRLIARVTGVPPGGVRRPVLETEMLSDLARSGLEADARFWVMRGVSSSVIVVVDRKPVSGPCA
jgi:ubiquinone/menaquinone biosynthesis C-methylase UbiE